MDICNGFTLRALKITTLALSMGMALAYAGVAQAAPQYSMSCIACHQMPPLDSATAKKNPSNGAVPGNHQGHASAAVSSCAKCHEDGNNTVATYGNSHRNKIIELSNSLNYSRKVGGFLNQTSVPPTPLGTCAANCHSDGKGHLIVTPAWGSGAFQYPADCTQCHAVAPATGNHPTTGTKHAAYFGTGTGSCVYCHADHTTFAHATSAGRAIEVKLPGAGRFAGTNCSTVYCHSNGKGTFATPIWGGAALECSGCHGTATVTGAVALSPKHANHVNNAGLLGTNYGCVECHSNTVSGNSTISSTENHTNGTIDLNGAHLAGGSCATSYCHTDGKGAQKTVTWTDSAWTSGSSCKGCHGSASAQAFASVAGEPNYANAVHPNSHQKHVAVASDCQNCHSTTTLDGVSIVGNAHTNGAIETVKGNGKDFTIVGQTCSNISCHSGNGIVASVPPATWGVALACDGCHGYGATLATNAHSKHVSGKGYICSTCHNGSTHINANVEVAGAGLVFAPVPKTCATSACHGSSTPSWANLASGGCGSCHDALSGSLPNGLISTNAHSAHYTAAYGPGFNGASATGANSCATCHVYTTDTAATHPNGTPDLNIGYSKNGACSTCHAQTTNWATGKVSCESCHSTTGGALSVIGGVTAPDKTAAATSGHGKAGIAQACTACHDNTGSHISGVLGDNNRLRAGLTGSANAECNFCHLDSGKVTAQTLNMKVHKASGLGSTCADCHDAHGTANTMMVNTTINGTAVSFTENNTFANGGRNGVCQVCHTTTAYFTKAGQPATTHVDSSTNCLDCHKHNPANGLAFVANGACDACHGYPPAPKVVGTAVTFGVQGNWSSARFEDYSGGGGAHLVAAHIPLGAKASDGWINCISCHSGGDLTHAKALPIRSHVENVAVSVQPQYRFSNDVLIAYTSAKFISGGANKSGSCFNVSCHMAPTPKWSIER